MKNDEEWDCFYETQAASLEAKPYSTLDAIQNVFALALKRDLLRSRASIRWRSGPSLSAGD